MKKNNEEEKIGVGSDVNINKKREKKRRISSAVLNTSGTKGKNFKIVITIVIRIKDSKNKRKIHR